MEEWSASPLKKGPLISLNRMPGEKNLLPLVEIEPLYLSHTACNLVTILQTAGKHQYRSPIHKGKVDRASGLPLTSIYCRGLTMRGVTPSLPCMLSWQGGEEKKKKEEREREIEKIKQSLYRPGQALRVPGD
jgi:hypothetical protein